MWFVRGLRRRDTLLLLCHYLPNNLIFCQLEILTVFIKLLSAALLFISGTKVVVAVDHKMFPKQQVLRMKKPDWVVCLNMSHFTFCSQVSLSARSAFESFCFQFYSDDLSPEVKAWTQKKQTIENILPDTT